MTGGSYLDERGVLYWRYNPIKRRFEIQDGTRTDWHEVFGSRQNSGPRLLTGCEVISGPHPFVCADGLKILVMWNGEVWEFEYRSAGEHYHT